ncbi:MAG: hypothetical protein IJ308_03785 [Clostridia bacterium]|nr:hypothetical protein [Clostridia bacterium]
MNQEIEYAEMLEIPVSTVNVVRKKRRKKNEKNTPPAPAKNTENIPVQNTAVLPAPPLKDTVIAQVNERIGEENENAATPAVANENQPVYTPVEEIQNEGALRLDPVPERIDTVRLYAADEMRDFERNGFASIEPNLDQKQENPPTVYATKDKKMPKAVRIALGVEFACACALCGAIFLTNVFLPGSAINTFFRGMMGVQETQTVNNRVYSDFELSPIVSDFSNVTLSLSETGVLSFTDECCVYPAADGEVAEIAQTEDGYMVKIRYSTTFTGVFNGLDQVFYAVGDKVKENVPVGFSDGETEVQVTMYSDGELLNCFRLTEENCLAWVNEE